MARRSRPRRGGQDKIVGTLLIAAAVAALIGAGATVWWVRGQKEALDADGCPRSGPKAIHLIMIDRSDPITGQQAQIVRQRVQQLKAEARFGARFDVYTFEGDTKNEMKPMLRVCAPGRPEEASQLTANPDLLRRKYDEGFSTVIDQEVDRLLRAETQPNSPILESLRAAAISSFGPTTAGTIPLRVTLVSDMVQHTTLASHFRTEPNFNQLSKNQAWASLQPNLKGAQVDVLYLLRPTAVRGGAPIQNRGHMLFWEQLIAAGGGRVSTMQPI